MSKASSAKELNASNSYFQKVESGYLKAINNFLSLLKYSLRYWRFGLSSSLLLTLNGILRSLAIFALGPIVKIILTGSSTVVSPLDSPPPSVGGNLFSIENLTDFILHSAQQQVGVSDPFQVLLVLCLFVLSLVAVTVCCQFFGQYLAWKFQMFSFYNLQKKVFGHISRRSLRFFYTHKIGELMSRTHNDISVSLGMVQKIISSLTTQPIVAVSLLFVLIQTNPQLTTVAFVSVLFSGVIIILFSRGITRIQSGVMSQLAAVTSIIQESFANIKLIKLLNLETTQTNKFFSTAMEHMEQTGRIMRRKFFAPSLIEFAGFCSLLVILLFGSREVFAAKMSADSLIMFMVVTFNLIPPVKALGDTITSFFSVLGASERVFHILQEADDVVAGQDVLTGFEHEIRFDGVWFGYDDKPVLREISFTIKKGETLAIVGPSGCGKSTLADLILRLYDPGQGTISIDEVSVQAFSLESYRKLFGVVTQETYLFNDTIENNILCGQNSTESEVVAAAEVANAHGFVTSFSAGYQTTVGDRGVKLSGGQRQRLAIARAIFRKPEILLFDEATSALDGESEKIVQQAIDNILGKTTAVIIAHRLSTIKNADKIIVMDSGRVVEMGTHNELLGQDGAYRKMCDIHYQQELKRELVK